MGETFVCDECDKRITSGYTVAWSEKLTDSAAGVHFSVGSKQVRNLCPECMPDEALTFTDRVKQMLGL